MNPLKKIFSGYPRHRLDRHSLCDFGEDILREALFRGSSAFSTNLDSQESRQRRHFIDTIIWNLKERYKNLQFVVSPSIQLKRKQQGRSPHPIQMGNRYYHTFSGHIIPGIVYLYKNFCGNHIYYSRLTQWQCNLLVAWAFHDSAYIIDTRIGDEKDAPPILPSNEYMSAESSEHSLSDTAKPGATVKAGWAQENISEVKRLIVLTQHKEPVQEKDEVGQIITDVDLMTFSQPECLVRIDRENVIQEYSQRIPIVNRFESPLLDQSYVREQNAIFISNLLESKNGKMYSHIKHKSLNETARTNIKNVFTKT